MWKKTIYFLALLLPLFLLILWCWKEITNEIEITSSVFQYCENNWWTSEFRELSDWNELWTCFFLDGSFCDVWDYEEWFCKPGDNPVVKNNVEKMKCDDNDCEELG